MSCSLLITLAGLARLAALAVIGATEMDAGAPAGVSAPTDAGAPMDPSGMIVGGPAGPQPRPAHGAKPKATLDYELRPARDGTGDLLYEEASFIARVAVDGGVTFHDKGLKLSFWPPFLPVRRATPGVPSLQATLSALARGRKPRASEGEPPPDDSFLIIPNVTPYRPDPREGCPGCGAFQPLVLPANVTGQLDLTEELMRFSGGDPYRLQKARFLAGTRERRIRMAVAAHADWVRRATAELPARLEEVACDQRRSRAERRAILRALRDEMNGSPEGQAAAARISALLDARFERPDAGEGCAAVPGP